MPRLCRSLPGHGLLLPEVPWGRMDAVGRTGEPKPWFLLPDLSRAFHPWR